MRGAIVAAAIIGLALGVPCDAHASDSVAAVRDETYRLDAADRRIERDAYDASLDVGITSPVRVRAGAEVQAAHLSLDLHGIRGTVRFHGDLSRLLRVTASHPARARSAQEKL